MSEFEEPALGFDEEEFDYDKPEIVEEPEPEEEYVDFDFDESIKAQAGPAPKMRVYGRVYTLPRSAPAKAILIGARLERQKGKNTTATFDDLMTMMASFFTQAGLDQMVEDGIGFDELVGLIPDVQKIYQSRNPRTAKVASPKE